MTQAEFNALVNQTHEGDLKRQRYAIQLLGEEVFAEKTPLGTKGTTTAGSITVSEFGNAGGYKTVIDLVNVPLIVTTAAADLAAGKLLYTLPDGDIVIKSAAIALGLEGTAALVEDDTPDLGIGTVIATGAVDVLGGIATFENIMTGQTIADCQGTVKVAAVDTILPVLAAAAHTIHLNVAAGWAGADAGVKVSGRIVIEWNKLS
jgi:hypothetical protein